MLEHNPDANRGRVEFLRLKIAPRDTKGVFAAGFQGRVTTANVLGKIDYRFKTRFKILAMSTGTGLVEVEARKMLVGKNFPEERFAKEIHRYIDEGIPLLWGLTLGLFPGEPAIAQQSTGGHLRMIIGYNDKTGHLLFSDSWGAGHELKKMTSADAYRATLGLFVMFPTVR